MDDLDDILGYASPSQREGKSFGSERSLRGRLEDDRVSCDDCRKNRVDRDKIREAG